MPRYVTRPKADMPIAINVTQRLFCDMDGFVHPITNWFDGEGDECEPEDAVVAVAGSEGRWFTLTLAGFVDPAE